MIVTCESCQTKFRLDPSRLREGRGKVRCSRCGHVFGITAPEQDRLLPVGLSDDVAIDDDPLGAPSVPESIGPAARKTGRRWMFPLLALVLVALGAIGWLFSHRGAAPTEEAATATPAAPGVPAVTILDSTQAFFLENAQAGQIFVVQGEVANESPGAVSFVLVEGKLYASGNTVAQAQKCFAGNPMSRDELQKLGLTDIQNRMMNREGKDLSNVHIPAGKRVPFVLVFHNLPELDQLGDYSIEVVSAKAD